MTATSTGTASTATAARPLRPAPFRIDYDTSQRVSLGRIERVVPDRLVLIDAPTIALEWTGACNSPAAGVTIDQRELLQVELVGSFRIIDCVCKPQPMAHCPAVTAAHDP